MRWVLVGARSETDTHTLFLVLSVVGLLRVVGLVVDGGVKIRVIQRADTLAVEAMRAGGQAIRVPLAITGEPPLAVARAAAAAAEAYLWTDEVTGDVVITTEAANPAGRREHGSHGVLRADRSRHPDSSGQTTVTLVHGVSEATR
jgi:hypothetical protein